MVYLVQDRRDCAGCIGGQVRPYSDLASRSPMSGKSQTIRLLLSFSLYLRLRAGNKIYFNFESKYIY